MGGVKCLLQSSLIEEEMLKLWKETDMEKVYCTSYIYHKIWVHLNILKNMVLRDIVNFYATSKLRMNNFWIIT